MNYKHYMRTLAVAFVFPVLVFAQEAKQNLVLMPWPAQMEVGAERLALTKDFNLSIEGNYHPRIYKAANSFLRRLDGQTGLFFKQGVVNSATIFDKDAQLKITIENKGTTKIHEDESYVIDIDKAGISLRAKTDIGAMHGLETLLQLQQTSVESYYFPEVHITDAPRFAWRGLMIDVARHFQPVEVIKRNLDGMAAVKMNVFHWHLSDDQGFRVAIKKHPKLTELGSDGLYYTQAQIKEVVAYADALGILVIPEIDVPGHASAILAAYPELGSMEGSYAVERNAGIFDPTLDPTNKKTYKLLNDIFKELAPLFPGKYIHIGGDENEGKHWDENPEIVQFKEKNNLKTNHDLQTYFNIKLQKILAKYDKELVGWEEIMTPDMPTTAIIHSWRGVNEGLPAKQSLVNAVKNGYTTILSNGYYIDLMYPASAHYLVDPLPDVSLSETEQQRILGGEATMWSELVTPMTIDSRIWPRTAAIAERFWSPKTINDVDDMYRRLGIISFQLEAVGLTHIKNRPVILRSIANNQDITPLLNLTKICEPLKGYTRNKGGTEYQSYSPFTLFADACTTDAADARRFHKMTQAYIGGAANSDDLLRYFEHWKANELAFQALDSNPTLAKLHPLSRNMAVLSQELISGLTAKQLTPDAVNKINGLLEVLSVPYVDVEMILIDDLKALVTFLQSAESP